MADRVSIDAELWDLVPEFLERRKADMYELQVALDGRDFSVLRRVGHNLRGSAASYGFARISKIGRALEAAACGRDLDGARDCVNALGLHLETLEPVRA